MSDPRDGHSEVRTGKECVMDFGDVTDDEEVQLNLSREEDMEWNLPGEDIRDLPGDTALGASVINQEEQYRMGLDRSGPGRVGRFRLLRSPVVRGRSYSRCGRF